MQDICNSLDKNLIRKYEQIRVPYYTTYPTGGEWDNHFTYTDYVNALKQSLRQNERKLPLALYVHFNFCPELCFYCLCIKTVTKDRRKITEFLKYLHREIDLFFKLCDQIGIEPDVRKIQIGGGTPSYMKREEFSALLSKLCCFVDIDRLDEFVIEVDPRTVDVGDIDYYLDNGINRLSFGIQDFDPKVQKAISRIQPYEMVEPLVRAAKRRCSVNLDLIYGLPRSNRKTFRETIRLVKALAPDRLSVYNYDYTPEIHKGMRAIKAEQLPGLEEKTLIYIETVEDLLKSGYEYVGIDHFAKPTDNLAKAYKKKTIWRSLNGYTANRLSNFEVGFGLSSIGNFSKYYVQNVISLIDYYQSIEDGRLPVFRGIYLNRDDEIRREVIFTILCHHQLEFASIMEKYQINFRQYFHDELMELGSVQKDKFVELDDDRLKVTGLGKIFVHHVCKIFDNRLRKKDRYVRTHEAILREKAGI